MVVWDTCCTLVLGIQEDFTQILSAFFSWQKRIAFKCSLGCTFIPWLLDSLDQPRYGSESHTQPYTQVHNRLVSSIDYGFDQWSVVSFVAKKVFVYLFMVKACIYRCTSCKYVFTFYELGISLNKFFLYFRIFCWPCTQREL